MLSAMNIDLNALGKRMANAIVSGIVWYFCCRYIRYAGSAWNEKRQHNAILGAYAHGVRIILVALTMMMLGL